MNRELTSRIVLEHDRQANRHLFTARRTPAPADIVWRIGFEWAHDRWRHFLEWPGTPAERVAEVCSLRIASVEGTADDAVPPSSVFQDVHLERHADDVVEVQLFGQAGKNIFSGSVRCDAGRGLIDCDFSVRVRDPRHPALPHSTYEASPSLAARRPLALADAVDGEALTIDAEANLVLTASVPARLTHTTGSATAPPTWRIALPASDPPPTTPHTLQHRYQFRFL